MAGQYKVATAATPALRTTAFEDTRSVLRRFEDVVVGPFFDGDTLDIVDFATGPALLRLARLDHILETESFAKLPRMAAWSQRLAERPAFRDTLIADFEERFRTLVVEHRTIAA